MNEGTAGIIDSTGKFIGSSANWALNEFLVFFVILFIVVIFVIFYFAQRNSAKTTDLVISIQKESAQIVANNTAVMGANLSAQKDSSQAITALLEKALNKHEQTQDRAEKIGIDILEIKQDVKEIKNMCGDRRDK